MRSETKHSLVLIAGTGLSALLSLAYAVHAGNVLGPALYADFAGAISLVSLCNIALGPINGTVTRFTAQYACQGAYGKILTLSREVARRVALYGLMGGGFALLMLTPLTDAFNFRSVWPILVAVGVVYLTLLLSVARGVLRGVQSFGHYSLNIALEAVVRLFFGVVLLSWVCSAVSGLLAYPIGLVVVLMVSRAQLRRVWGGCEPQSLDGTAVRQFALPMFVLMFASAGFENADMLFVKHYFSESEAGVYGSAFTLVRAISVIATPFCTLMLPLLTRLHEQGDGLSRSFVRVCGHFLLLSAVPLLLFAIWSEKIMLLLYGQPYIEAAPLLLPLAGARLVGYLGAMIALFHASTGRFGFLMLYLPVLAIEVVALFVWCDSLIAVVIVALVAQIVGLGLMGLHFAMSIGRHRQRRASSTRHRQEGG